MSGIRISPGKQCEGECGSPDSLEFDLSQGCPRRPNGHWLCAFTASVLSRSAGGGSTSLPTHQQQQLKMDAWDKVNHLALVTMVQAAQGPDEGPLVEFDLPALDSMLSGLSGLRVE